MVYDSIISVKPEPAPAVQQTLDGGAVENYVSSSSPENPGELALATPQAGTKLVIHGSRYEPDIPAVLLEYAKTNPYLNAASTYSLAAVFGVTHQTISNWMKNHPEFREVVESLRERQLNRVESAMMKRILGCTLKETRIAKTDAGTLKQTVEKEIPPDPVLIRYYLEHHAPECWGAVTKAAEDPAKKVTIVVENDPEEFA